MKTLNNSDVNEATKQVKDIEVYGDGDTFHLLCKASSKAEGWMKSTKVCNLYNGCIVQVSTQQGDNVAESLSFVPNVNIDLTSNPRKLVPIKYEIDTSEVSKISINEIADNVIDILCNNIRKSMELSK